jgi:hypothetical protein
MPRTTQTKEQFGEARARQTARVFRQQIAGLAAAGLVVLAFALWRAGWNNVFTPGWWRW